MENQNSQCHLSVKKLTFKSYKFHKPKRMMKSYKPKRLKSDNFKCDLCGIEVTSQQTMDIHIRGRKHMNKLNIKTTGSISPTLNKNDVNQESTTPLNTTISLNQSSTNVKEFISFSGKSVLQSMNELAKFNKLTAKYDLISESGPGHCKKFEVRLTIADETYTGNGTSIKRAQQIAAEEALTKTKLKRPGQFSFKPNLFEIVAKDEIPSNDCPEYPAEEEIELHLGDQEMNPIDENKLEEFLIKKHAEIIEEDHTMKEINEFVRDIEHALQIVSNRILEQYQSQNIRTLPQSSDSLLSNNNFEICEDSLESYRMIKGAMKISILAMHLGLKIDHQYSLVLICANKPTVTLLNSISQELTIALNKQNTLSNYYNSTEQEGLVDCYKVEVQVADACLIIKSSHLPYHTIRITLTSPVFHNEQYFNVYDPTSQNLATLNPDPMDILDKNKCLQALVEIRHSNWFTRSMIHYNYNLVVLQLLRYLQCKQTPLSYLNLWCLIVIVYKCQYQSHNSISALFRAVFTYLSSGVLLSTNVDSSIIDPCEKDLVDVTNYLTNEQRSNITSYAQYILRLITCEQIDKLFPID